MSSLRLGKKVLVWEPFSVELSPHGFLDLVQGMEDAGLQVSSCEFNDCTISSVDNMTDFDYIIIHTHGSSGGNWFCTHEIVTPEKDEIYNELLASHLVGKGQVHYVDGAEQPIIYKVSGEYIRNLQGRFNNSIVFAGFCHGMDNGGDGLCNAFHDKGASVFCGFDGSVGSRYDDEIGTALTEHLVYDKMLMGEAYDMVRNDHPDRPLYDEHGNIKAHNRFRMDERSDRGASLFILPAVQTHPAENITNTSALLKGTIITDENCLDIIEKGFCYGTGPGMYYGNVGGDIIVYQGSETDDFSCEVTDLYPDMQYYVRAYAKTTSGVISYGDELSFTTLNGSGPDPDIPEYVDLGLPSGTLWATCNVGANAPEEYGDYFAWGETQPKDYYDWNTYQYCNGGISKITKYCNRSTFGYNEHVDNLTTLLSEDDAATANLGEGWRMPTYEECNELIEHTTTTWTTKNGVHGCLFSAENGNSIFLPASGVKIGNEHSSEGSAVACLSSNFDVYNAYGIAAGVDYIQAAVMGYRYQGLTVRPVRAQSYDMPYVVNASPNRTGCGELFVWPPENNNSNDCKLTATANGGYTFTNWTENGTVVSTSATYSFTLTSNRTLVANFTANPVNYTVSVSANPTSGGSVTGGGTYQQGQSCTVTASANSGYTFTNWTENGAVVSTEATYSFTVTGNRTLVANFAISGSNAPEGAINGLFTINDYGNQVYFSKGNLQYQASTNTWRFAEHQWDYVGEDNANVSPTYSGWIDLFGWGTSGWNCGNTYYRPWDSDDSDATLYGPRGNYDLTGSYSHSDWGVHNAISNGGNTPGQWRTLTGSSNSEWSYLLYDRSASIINGVADARFAKAMVANVHGIILFPDSYTHPSGVAQPIGVNDEDDSGWNGNNYSAAEFELMQSAGAVFLPAAGARNGTEVWGFDTDGYYRSASYARSATGMYFGKYSYDFTFDYGWVNMDDGIDEDRSAGQSVRLVRNAR